MSRLFILPLLISSFFSACTLLGAGDDLPDISGKIVFAAPDNSGTSQIYRMNANGSGLRKLTSFSAEGGGADPAWSPDGRRIVFTNFTGATTLGPYLYVMDANGSNMRPLKRRQSGSVTALIGSAPAWSPDGTRIVFQVCTNCGLGGSNYEISIVEVAGEDYDPDQLHAVTNHPARDTHPTWSPDGRRIAFISDRDYMDADTLRFRKDLYLLEADSSNVQRITRSGFPGDYVWMDVNKIIQVETNRTTNLKQVVIVKAETGSKTPIIENAEFKNQLLVFWNHANQQLFTINKNHKELPLVVASYDLEGNILNEIQLDATELKSAVNFDWYMSTNN